MCKSKKILKSLVAAIACSSTFAVAADFNYKLPSDNGAVVSYSNPLIIEGEVESVRAGDHIKVQIKDYKERRDDPRYNDEYRRLEGISGPGYYHKDRGQFEMHIAGLREADVKKYRAASLAFSKYVLDDAPVELICIGKNEQMQIPECMLLIGDIDYAHGVIFEGLFKYDRTNQLHEKDARSYAKAEEVAKLKLKGVWSSGYGMFELNDENKLE
ncbi:hypothetical protein [Neptuniibacter sp. QD37_11]|uniref:hypothetical protein n=1 Tax=Neptuniibacter sp. QD37_11 TaxID=3398209 RepID=UPI0039F543E4